MGVHWGEELGGTILLATGVSLLVANPYQYVLPGVMVAGGLYTLFGLPYNSLFRIVFGVFLTVVAIVGVLMFARPDQRGSPLAILFVAVPVLIVLTAVIDLSS